MFSERMATINFINFTPATAPPGQGFSRPNPAQSMIGFD
jgi:hypothetical protein